MAEKLDRDKFLEVAGGGKKRVVQAATVLLDVEAQTLEVKLNPNLTLEDATAVAMQGAELLAHEGVRLYVAQVEAKTKILVPPTL